MDAVPTTGPFETPPARRDWPVGYAFVTAWLLPATSARRMARTPLRQAFYVHLLCLLVIPVEIIALAIWADWLMSTSDFQDGIATLMSDLVEAFRRDPVVCWSALGAAAIGIEAGFVLLALLLAPWGACDEPMRSSTKQSLRTVWLSTPLFTMLVMLIGLSAGLLAFANDRFWESPQRPTYPDQPWPTAPTPPTTRDAAALEAYRKAMTDYQQAVQEASNRASVEWHTRKLSMPWYVRYSEEIMGVICVLAGLWALWAIMRGVGARPAPTPIARPPTCEACGYNLVAADAAGRCPECGEPVAASLGTDARPGTPWHLRRNMGRFRAWRQCTAEAMLRPQAFGRRLRTLEGGTDHRRFLAMHLPLAFVVGFAGTIVCYVAESGRNPIGHYPALVVFLAPLLGTVSAVVVVIATLAAAGAAALWHRWKLNRNLMHAGMQGACYLGVGMVVWVAAAFLTAAVVLANPGAFRALARRIHVDREVLGFLAWVAPMLACGACLFHRLLRITSGARFANR